MTLSKALTLCGALLILTARIPMAAQEAAPPQPNQPPPRVEKVIDVKYADVAQLAQLLSIFQASIRPNPQMKVISVVGSKESVAAIEETVRKYDVPPAPTKNVELTFSMVVASRDQGNGSLPSDLESVSNQLTKLFGYKGYRLLETAISRNRVGERGEVHGGAPAVLNETRESNYRISYLRTEIGGSADKASVRVDNLEFSLRVPVRRRIDKENPNRWDEAYVSFTTNLDLAEGQKVVVGKSNIAGTGNDLILILTARILP